MPPESLRRRNAVWAQLRSLPPGSAAFEAALAELHDLTGWDRTRVLAGLGLTDLDPTHLDLTGDRL